MKRISVIAIVFILLIVVTSSSLAVDGIVIGLDDLPPQENGCFYLPEEGWKSPFSIELTEESRGLLLEINKYLIDIKEIGDENWVLYHSMLPLVYPDFDIDSFERVELFIYDEHFEVDKENDSSHLHDNEAFLEEEICDHYWLPSLTINYYEGGPNTQYCEWGTTLIYWTCNFGCGSTKVTNGTYVITHSMVAVPPNIVLCRSCGYSF